MKRRISLVIALAISFLMMFGSIAKAEEIKVPIPASISEQTNLEIIIKVPPAQMNQADSPWPQAKVSSQVLPQAKIHPQVLEEGKQMSDGIHPQGCTFMCYDGRPGYLRDGFCKPC